MRLPEYLKRGIIDTDKTKTVRALLKKHALHTICESGRCPNKAECYAHNTASFLIMGDICTRNCRYCNVTTGRPLDLDGDEPQKLAQTIQALGLKYAVITSVTRDDLPDGGAEHFAKTIRAIKSISSEIKVEVLVPDFKGDKSAIDTVLAAKPDVFNHNIEVVPSLYKTARPQGSFERAIDVLNYAKQSHPEIPIKTGMMIGLGENDEEILEVLRKLKSIDCDIVTIGQYLQPSKAHLEVKKYYSLAEYDELTKKALEIGIKAPVFAPLVRSSYHASIALEKANCCSM